MSLAEEYRNGVAQLHRIVAQGGRRISLVEFATLPQLQGLIDELRAAQPGRAIVTVAYDPFQTTAPYLVNVSKRELEQVPAKPLPLLILHPRELRSTPKDEQAAYDFWQAMNFRRELWGQTPAQILLCVDPWHKKWLVDRAADLWSWLMPKLHLIPPSNLSVSPPQSLAALSSFAEYHISPEAAEKQWQNSWPLLEKKKSERQIEPGDFRRLVFPLLESCLATGNLVRARQVRDAVAGTVIPDVDKIQWHKLNAQLACGAGDFAQAEEHARKLLELAKNHPEPHVRSNAVDALILSTNLLSNFGQADATEVLNRELIGVTQELFGPEHPNTLSSRNNLAIALRAQGKYVEAEQEHRVVLAIRQRVFGPEHLDTLRSRNNLATALAAQGKYAEAEQEQRAVVSIRQPVLGPEHPATFSSRNNLASMLSDQGKYAEAEQEQRAVLAIRERVLGPEHPDVLQSYHNLAVCLCDQGKMNEVLESARHAEQGYQKVLGPEHPNSKNAKELREQIEAAMKDK